MERKRAPPQLSNVHLPGDRERLAGFDAGIAHGAFHFRMAGKKLHSSEIPGLAVDFEGSKNSVSFEYRNDNRHGSRHKH